MYKLNIDAPHLLDDEWQAGARAAVGLLEAVQLGEAVGVAGAGLLLQDGHARLAAPGPRALDVYLASAGLHFLPLKILFI